MDLYLILPLPSFVTLLTDTSALPQGYNYGASDGIGILAMAGGMLGAIIAAVIAVLLDRTGRD